MVTFNGATASLSPQAPPPPLTPESIPKATEAIPCPTTFVQANTSSFKQVVQVLTGSAETAAPTVAATTNSKHSIRQAAVFSPRRQLEILSPTMLDFPSLVLSPVTPLIPNPFNRPTHPGSEANKLVEDQAIAEKGFYLHPWPRVA
ncbi:putative VQ motif-containing protein 4 [Cocos nucifera]|uniref:Putative VQ motif-containing protein 4 n=1 Tax=Cocos nucifera TaxID=13894 RepID=A0A8K0I3S2_COCNU|nr:putative VQ motif-containing protein 4 [Cocos nucifera]